MEIKHPQLYPGIEAEVAEVFNSFPGYVASAVAAVGRAPASSATEAMIASERRPALGIRPMRRNVNLIRTPSQVT
jgi:hypothetical protein